MGRMELEWNAAMFWYRELHLSELSALRTNPFEQHGLLHVQILSAHFLPHHLYHLFHDRRYERSFLNHDMLAHRY